jgi:hypothetical protein
MPAANTRGCFNEFVGQRLIGLLFDALPVNRRDIAAGTRTLIFEDGRGLTIAPNGSYWIDSADEVARAVRDTARKLDVTAAQLREALAVAGEPVIASALTGTEGSG